MSKDLLKPEIIEQVHLIDGKVRYDAKITGKFGVPMYYVIQKLSLTKPVQALLYSIKSQLVEEFDNERFDDLELIDDYRKELHDFVIKKLGEEDDLEGAFAEYLASELVHELTGLKDIDLLLLDENIEEIVLNNPHKTVWIAHRKHGWLKTNIRFDSTDKVMELINVIATMRDKSFSETAPLLDTALWTGDRVNCTHPMVSVKGYPSITIRKFNRDPFTVVDFIKNKTATVQAFATLWQAVENLSNILVVGGTGTGKTSFLNVINLFNPPNRRIVTIEDTPEIRMPATFENHVGMITAEANIEGKGQVDHYHLLMNSLRQRPDTIILQEIRKAPEARVGFEAMKTGHSFSATFHATRVKEAVDRLQNEPINVPADDLNALDLIIVLNRNNQNNRRRVIAIAEIGIEEIGDVRSLEAPEIFSYNTRLDRLDKQISAEKFYKSITRKSGKNVKEIEADLQEKISILSWMVKHDLRHQDLVAKIMAAYYNDRNDLLESVKKDKDSL